MLEILFLNLNEDKNCNIFPGFYRPQIPQLYNKPNLFANVSLSLYSSQYAMIFSQSSITSGILWYADDCAWRLHNIPYLASLGFNFYLKQKQRFSVWNFIENVSFICFHEGIWSRYSQINKFKISKDVFFQITKTI